MNRNSYQVAHKRVSLGCPICNAIDDRLVRGKELGSQQQLHYDLNRHLFNVTTD